MLEKIGEHSQPICNYIIYVQPQISFVKHKKIQYYLQSVSFSQGERYNTCGELINSFKFYLSSGERENVSKALKAEETNSIYESEKFLDLLDQFSVQMLYLDMLKCNMYQYHLSQGCFKWLSIQL